MTVVFEPAHPAICLGWYSVCALSKTVLTRVLIDYCLSLTAKLQVVI